MSVGVESWGVNKFGRGLDASGLSLMVASRSRGRGSVVVAHVRSPECASFSLERADELELFPGDTIAGLFDRYVRKNPPAGTAISKVARLALIKNANVDDPQVCCSPLHSIRDRDSCGWHSFRLHVHLPLPLKRGFWRTIAIFQGRCLSHEHFDGALFLPAF